MKTALLLWTALIFSALAQLPAVNEEPIDWARAHTLHQRAQRGEKLAPDDQTYYDRAKAVRARQQPQRGPLPKPPEGLIPLTDMSADARYQGEDGGLYGGGKNTPPAEHEKAARAALAKVQPLDKSGQPSPDGRIVFVSISMSNATQEFSVFKRIADADSRKSPALTIVDCAQGGQAMAEWVPRDGGPWKTALERISAAGVTPEQVQVAWVKLANKSPRGPLADHGRKLEKDTEAVLQNARAHFPNLRVVYLGSRIYGGYATSTLNPEPYAYESAFAARWLIQRQMKGDAALAQDKSPVLLWGPYLWADGTHGRKTNPLVWERSDLGPDGTHPSEIGREKVARLLLDFVATDPLAQKWFTGK